MTAIETGFEVEPSLSAAGQTDQVDRERVARWAEAYGISICAFALRLVRDRALAEDVVQETLVVALERAASTRVPAPSEKAWLLGIARRIAVRAVRRRAGFLARLLRREPPFAATARCSEGDALVGEERRALVAAALDSLPARQRAVVYLVFHEGLTVDGSATVLGISKGSARRHSHRAKEALRDRLGRCGAFDDDE